jgi:sortase B
MGDFMKKKIIIFLSLILAIIEIMSIPKGSKDLVLLETELVEAKENSDVSKLEVETIQKERNSKNIVGVLKIPNTDYETVVTQGKDNSYFLTRDAKGNKKRGGTPFLDYRVNINNSKKLLIYGHNSKYSEMPFKILEKYYDKSFYNNHKYLLLTTENKKKVYEIFSVHVETEDWSYMTVNFKNSDEWLKHLEFLKNNSMYDTGVSIDKNDKILILQTCSTKKEYSKYKKKFLLIVAKEVDL